MIFGWYEQREITQIFLVKWHWVYPTCAHARCWTSTRKAWHQMTTAPLGRCVARGVLSWDRPYDTSVGEDNSNNLDLWMFMILHWGLSTGLYACLWYLYIYITWLHRVIGFINVYQPPHDWPQLCGHFWSNPRRCQVELPLGQAKGTGGHWDRSIHSFNGNSRILKQRLHRPYIWIYMVGTSNQSDPGVAIDSYGKTSIKPLSFLGFSR